MKGAPIFLYCVATGFMPLLYRPLAVWFLAGAALLYAWTLVQARRAPRQPEYAKWASKGKGYR